MGDHSSARMLRDALRIGFRSSAGPFRSLASIAVEPRSYQLVPLMMALRQDTVRLLIADDVGIGKTVESGLIAAELLATGQAEGMAVLCSPALAEQWQSELRNKFGLDASLVLPSTVTKLERGLGMNESLFQRHKYTVVSTDFIKNPKRRDEFVRAAPDLIIVDEAHTSVSNGMNSRTGSSTQRHELLRQLSAKQERHLLLVTATPHSGSDEGFHNLLELLEPGLPGLNLDSPSGRAELAKYFVQRRRADIRKYLTNTQYAQDTPFPSDRQSQERAYSLSSDYAALFDSVLDYARESVTDQTSSAVKQRVRWWSALSLLRSLASSPAAAADTLRKRAANAMAASEEEADSIGRTAVLDLGDDDTMEGADVAPGAITDPDDDTANTPARAERDRLLRFAKRAEALFGPAKDHKLAEVTRVVKGLLADGYDPIVFCRFIPTAEYVGDHLQKALGKSANVQVVTGTLPPDERVARIEALTDQPGRSVLVATDCLSEGVNLQDHFQAVVHYDLAWNPTRHEQREGRVDRFGQRADIVRAVTIYGKDNQIDGLVLDILLRKHEAIRKATGVSVPVPAESDSVVQAVLEGLLLRGRDSDQLELAGIADSQRKQLDQDWQSAAETEKASRTKYAQEGIKPDEVAAEIAEIRDALGSDRDVEEFVRNTLAALGSTPNDTSDGFTADTSSLPAGLRESLTPGHAEPLPFHDEPPTPRHAALIARTDPDVETIASFVLDAALDPKSLSPDLAGRLARRAGVFRSQHAQTRTTVLLLRHRLHLTLPGRTTTTQIVEHAELVGFTGPTTDPQWLDRQQVSKLVESSAKAIGAGQTVVDQLDRALRGLPDLADDLDRFADTTAETLRESHRRVRRAGADRIRGLAVEPIRPVDVLGVWVYLPETAGGQP